MGPSDQSRTGKRGTECRSRLPFAQKMHDLEQEFDKNLFVPGTKEGLNIELDKAIHLRDFFTMGELVAHDALSGI